MPIKLENITQFSGFGVGRTPGEYFHGINIQRTRAGISNGWSVEKKTDNATLTTMETVMAWFAQGKEGAEMYVYGMDDSCDIFSSQGGILTWAKIYEPRSDNFVNASGNCGMIVDQNNDIIYPTRRYIGRRDSTLTDYSTGTISVTNGSPTVTGSGTTFVAGDAGKQILIAGVYLHISAYVSATEVTLSANYAGTTASGLAYTIFRSYDDRYKDLGSNIDYPKPMDTFEDWVFGCAGPNVFAYNVTDHSFNSTAFTLPSAFVGRAIRANRTGVLIGASFNDKSALVLWDGYSDRSAAPWIWLKEDIRSIVPYDSAWVVITSKRIYITNGYSISTVAEEFVNNVPNDQEITRYLRPQGAEIIGDKLLFIGYNNSRARDYAGLYILDIVTKNFEFAQLPNGYTYDVLGGAIFTDSDRRTHISFTCNSSTEHFLCYLFRYSTMAEYVTSELGFGDTLKVAESLRITYAPRQDEANYNPYTFNLTLKIADTKRQMYSFAQQDGTASAANKLKPNVATTAEVGDEVRIMTGPNAGQVRHITSIAAGEWTMDSAFSNVTASGAQLLILPFKVVKKFSYSGLTRLRDSFFDIKDRIKSEKFFLKITIDSANFPLEIHGMQFIYNDLGIYATT